MTFERIGPLRSGPSRPRTVCLASCLVLLLLAPLVATAPAAARVAFPERPAITPDPGAVFRYPVNFSAASLPLEAPWNLTVWSGGVSGPRTNPQSFTTTNRSIVVLLANGSYGYSAFAEAEVNPTVADSGFDNGSFYVGGHAVSVPVWNVSSRVTNPPASAGPSIGLSNPETFTALVSFVALVALVVVVSALVGRRLGRPLPPAPPGPSGQAIPPPGPSTSGPVDATSTDPLRHML